MMTDFEALRHDLRVALITHDVDAHTGQPDAVVVDRLMEVIRLMHTCHEQGRDIAIGLVPESEWACR